MVKKLRINENAISDLRRIINDIDLSGLEDRYSGFYTTKYSSYNGKRQRGDFNPSEKTVKSGLINWLETTLGGRYNNYDFNTEQLELVPIDKPKGPTVAKKSPNLLIGIDTNRGNAVLIGQGQFYEYYSGRVGRSASGRFTSTGVPDNPVPNNYMKYDRVSLRDTFDSLNLWFEIVMPEDYQSRSEIRQSRQSQRVATRKYSDKNYTNKEIYYDEIALYDPEVARDNYVDRIKTVKNRRQYETILNSIEDINSRIRNIDFGHPIFGGGADFDDRSVRQLKSTYNDLVHHIEKLNSGIDRNSDWDIEYHSKKANEVLPKIESMLSDIFNV